MPRNRTSQKPFRRLLTVFFFWLIGFFFAGSMFEVYFLHLGLSLEQIYLADACWFFGALILIPIFRGFRTRSYMLIGIALAFIAASLLVLFPEPYAAYAYRLLLGSTMFFFWVPFNTAYYGFSKGNNATLGAIYVSMLPVISLLLPAFSGWLAANIGFHVLFLLSMASFAICFILTCLVLKDDKEHRYHLLGSLRSLSGLRSIIFIEGFSITGILSVTLPVMLLLYLDKPVEVGVFLSLATIFSIISTFILSSLSDRCRRRSIFLIPSVIGFAIAAVLGSQASDLLMFFLAFGMANFFLNIFTPMALALAVDNTKRLSDTMVGREFMLNLGRLAGAFTGYIIFMVSDIRTALLLQALFLLLYIPVFEIDKKMLKYR